MLNIQNRKNPQAWILTSTLFYHGEEQFRKHGSAQRNLKLFAMLFATLYLTLNGFKVLDSYYFSAQLFRSWLTFAPGAWHPRALACSGACRISLM